MRTGPAHGFACGISRRGFVTATGVRQKGGVRGNQVLRCCDGRASTRKTMIVALARKLLIGLWRCVTTGGASLIPQCERHFRLAHPSSRHSAPPLCGHASADTLIVSITYNTIPQNRSNCFLKPTIAMITGKEPGKFIIAPRAQASRRCETQASLSGKPLSFG